MRTETFVTADLHLGHVGICEKRDDDNRKVRPWASPEEMDEAIIARWNATVRPNDKVYVLGDVVINRRCLPTLFRLNGRLRLVSGNHDTFRTREYLERFDEVMGCRVKGGAILTHIPIHPQCVDRFGLNIHGHLHSGRIVTAPDAPFEFQGRDPRYLCVSMEQTLYKPIPLEEAMAIAAANGYMALAA